MNKDKVLLTVTTGARPQTASICAEALRLLYEQTDLALTVDVRAWHHELSQWDYRFSVHPSQIKYKAELLNHSILWYQDLFGDHPDYWVTMDDDVVVSPSVLSSGIKLLKNNPSLGLLGPWNRLSELNKGTRHNYGSTELQLGNDFCVGGALHIIPKRVIEEVGAYDPVMREEDAMFTNRVRAAGYEAAIMVNEPVTVLEDDGIIQDYRQRILELHYQHYDRWK